MQIATVLLSAALFVTGPRAAADAATAAPPPTRLDLKRAVVASIEEAKIPAQEAGVLSVLKVAVGDSVSKGQLLGQIDDAMARLQLQAAQAKLAVAKEEANSNVAVAYAIASNQTAVAEYNMNKDVNARIPNTVSQTEMVKFVLKCTETALSAEKARMDKRIAALQTNEGQAAVDAAAETIKRHQIISPLEGEVEELYRHEGEWVQPTNDPNVMRIVRLDRLWVIDAVKVDKVNSSEIKGREVSVNVKLARDRVETFRGKITIVSPVVQTGDQVEVRAEIQNRKENGNWLLQPGLKAEMTIYLK